MTDKAWDSHPKLSPTLKFPVSDKARDFQLKLSPTPKFPVSDNWKPMENTEVFRLKNLLKKKLLQLDFQGRKITKDATRIAETELVSLAKKLYDDLSQDIFEKVTVDKMELTRNV